MNKSNIFYFLAWCLILIGAVVIAFYLFELKQEGWNLWGPENINIERSGEFGDFIGGFVGTLFSLAGFILLFLTLKDQRESFVKERFEERFFELIKLHRDNVSEFEIAGSVKGRACFKYMINELRYIYRLVEVGTQRNDPLNDNPKVATPGDYLKMAYLIMFFGIGYSSERQLMELFNDEEAEIFGKFVKANLEKVQKCYETKASAYQSIYFCYNIPINGVPDGFTFETYFYPFDGHSTRLGHYYRHLFQTVKYVDKQPSNLFSPDAKYDYTKTLRANLSNFEQLLLYYNSLSTLGKEWIDTDLIKRYALIKNIPLGIVDIGVHPHDVFGKLTDDGKYLFETDEIRARQKLGVNQ